MEETAAETATLRLRVDRRPTLLAPIDHQRLSLHRARHLDTAVSCTECAIFNRIRAEFMEDQSQSGRSIRGDPNGGSCYVDAISEGKQNRAQHRHDVLMCVPAHWCGEGRTQGDKPGVEHTPLLLRTTPILEGHAGDGLNKCDEVGRPVNQFPGVKL